jgi:hypothetical protein
MLYRSILLPCVHLLFTYLSRLTCDSRQSLKFNFIKYDTNFKTFICYKLCATSSFTR